ncbi:Ion-translocating oxidoreductase complex subunit G [Sinobacterium norvegicum]|uniref:Ion-translocating oxidoreductase complex subunit G n=1 Tax=Sinobacterium norvegicum TaxID=1641715 RepID=A0ABN8EIV7_9GAMM|nr:electron transport complex subunit RsxG [Sinobacterium norvegicum]CAH0992297.1 Ion-translocating oxidoreductase complex subunit G [Sinobacterium norvegicum]
MLAKVIARNAMALGAFAIITTGAIAATYLGTKDRIAVEERAAQARALTEIITDDQHNNSMLDETVMLDDNSLLGLKQAKPAFIARLDGEFVAAILPAIAPDGYSGDIQLITGIYADGSVAGVRVLVHNETPGLGDKADRKKSDWVDGFAGRSLGNPGIEQWTVKKDRGEFDQFTGATITPRAITKAVARSLEYFEANKALFITDQAQGEQQ